VEQIVRALAEVTVVGGDEDQFAHLFQRSTTPVKSP
jgi:hypothetical protein